MLADHPSPADLLHFSLPDSLSSVVATLHPEWRSEAAQLLAGTNWRAQVVAAAALIIAGSDAQLDEILWRALDGGSWIAPQLVAAAFLVDPRFEERAAERLLGVTRRGPKLMSALVRAYHRLEKPRMNVIAQLGRLDPMLQTEEGRIGVRALDGWLDQFPLRCDATMQARWVRRPRVQST